MITDGCELASQRDSCFTTQELAGGCLAKLETLDFFGEIVCCENVDCYNTFFSRTSYNGNPSPNNVRQYCSKKCRKQAEVKKLSEERERQREIKQRIANIAFAHLNRDRYFAFDGRREGPFHGVVKIVVRIKKDIGYHAMPADVHIEPEKPRFHMVTPEDVTWAEKQRSRPGQAAMQRTYHNFCAHCVEMIVDGAAGVVRVTKGVYLPIEHECKRVRVYNLQNQLIEVKEL